jgi:hypothetical protein
MKAIPPMDAERIAEVGWYQAHFESCVRKALRKEIRRRQSAKIWLHSLWISGVPHNRINAEHFKIRALDPEQLDNYISQQSYSCVEHILQIPETKCDWSFLPEEDLMFLYSVRRATPSPPAEDPLKLMMHVTQPSRRTISVDEVGKLAEEFLERRKVDVYCRQLPTFASNKSVIESPRSMGGRDRISKWYLRRYGSDDRIISGELYADLMKFHCMEHEPINETISEIEFLLPGEYKEELPKRYDPKIYHGPDGRLDWYMREWEAIPIQEHKTQVDLVEQYRAEWQIRQTDAARLVQIAYSVMIDRRERRPRLYALDIPQRGGKHRVPNIPEWHNVILAEFVGNIGFAVVGILCPNTFRQMKPYLPVSEWFFSGDYSNATDEIPFEVARKVWEIILTRVNMPDRVRNLCNHVLDYLIGPHDIFADHTERLWFQHQYPEEIKQSFDKRDEPIKMGRAEDDKTGLGAPTARWITDAKMEPEDVQFVELDVLGHEERQPKTPSTPLSGFTDVDDEKDTRVLNDADMKEFEEHWDYDETVLPSDIVNPGDYILPKQGEKSIPLRLVGGEPKNDFITDFVREAALKYGRLPFERHLPIDAKNEIIYVEDYPLQCEFITSVKSIGMCYGISFPVLTVINGLTHMGLSKRVSFVLTGDDNSSGHKDEKSIDDLITFQESTGMIVNRRKSYKSRVGYLHAEQIWKKDPQGKFMVKIPHPKARMIFPEKRGNHWCNIPSTVYDDLMKYKTSEIFKIRLFSFIYWLFRKDYENCRLAGLNIFDHAPKSIFPYKLFDWQNNYLLDAWLEGKWYEIRNLFTVKQWDESLDRSYLRSFISKLKPEGIRGTGNFLWSQLPSFGEKYSDIEYAEKKEWQRGELLATLSNFAIPNPVRNPRPSHRPPLLTSDMVVHRFLKLKGKNNINWIGKSLTTWEDEKIVTSIHGVIQNKKFYPNDQFLNLREEEKKLWVVIDYEILPTRGWLAEKYIENVFAQMHNEFGVYLLIHSKMPVKGVDRIKIKNNKIFVTWHTIVPSNGDSTTALARCSYLPNKYIVTDDKKYEILREKFPNRLVHEIVNDVPFETLLSDS